MGLLTTLGKKKKKTPLKKIEPVKIQPLQYFGLLNVEQKKYKKCNVHNIFKIFL